MAEKLAELNKSNLEVYSTDERQVGVWIDGKPLYEMTIPVTGTSPVNIDSYVGTVDKIMKRGVLAIRTNGTTLDSEFFLSTTDYFIVLVQKHNNSCSVRYQTTNTYQTIYVTVGYTK